MKKVLSLKTFFIVTILILFACSVTFAASLVSMNLKNVDIRDALRALGQQQNISFATDTTVVGKVSINLNKVKLDVALKSLLEVNGFYYEKIDSKTYKVTKNKPLITQKPSVIVEYDSKLVSLEANQGDLQEIARKLTESTGENVVCDPTISQRVSMVLSKIPLANLLEILANITNQTYEKVGDIHYLKVGQKLSTVSFNNGLLSVDARNENVRDLVREISQTSKVNITVNPNVMGQISILFRNLPIDKALSAISDSFGLRVSYEDGYYLLTKIEGVNTIKYENNLLTLDLRNADLTDVVTRLAQMSKTNILVDKEAVGRVSGAITNVQFEQGLTQILEANGLTLGKNGNILLIKRRPQQNNYTLNIKDGGKLDVNAFSVDSSTLLSDIAYKFQANLIIYNNARTTVNNIQLKDVTVDEAFSAILKGTSLTFKKNGNTYLVGDASGQRSDSLDLLSSAYIKIKHLPADNLLALLPSAFSSGNIKVNREQNALSAVGSQEYIDGLIEWIDTIDVDSSDTETEFVRLSNIKASDAQSILSKSFPAQMMTILQDGNTLVLVGPKQLIGKIKSQALELDTPGTRSVNEIIIFKNMSVENISNMLPPTLPLQNVKVIREQNAILITGSEDMVNQFKEWVKAVDVVSDDIGTELVRFSNVKRIDVLTVLSRMYSQQMMTILQDTNSIVISGPKLLVSRIKGKALELDVPVIETINELMKLNYIKPDDLTKMIPTNFKGVEILALKEQNAIVITGPSALVSSVKNYISKIDEPNPLILFDVLVVEYTDSNVDKIGTSLEAGAAKYDLTSDDKETPLVVNLSQQYFNPVNFSIQLQSLIQQQKAKIRANPRISTLNGYEASFNVVTKQMYWDPYVEDDNAESQSQTSTNPSQSLSSTLPKGAIRSIDTGIKVKLKPWVSASKDITIDIEPEISDAMVSGNNGAIQTKSRNVQTTVRVRDGETIVLGGLIQNNEQDITKKVPLLGDIPLIGKLFQSINKTQVQTEFVIYITPHLAKDSQELQKYTNGLATQEITGDLTNEI